MTDMITTKHKIVSEDVIPHICLYESCPKDMKMRILQQV